MGIHVWTRVMHSASHCQLSGSNGSWIHVPPHLVRLHVVHGVVARHVVGLTHAHPSMHVGLLHHVRWLTNNHLAEGHTH